MAPESSRVVVLPKFDMHIYTSELTSSELKEAIDEYCIPLDLHPRLPPLGMTMNRLPSRYIGLYIEQLEQEGLRVPFSSFFLAVIRHFGVHVSQLVPMGVNRGNPIPDEQRPKSRVTPLLTVGVSVPELTPFQKNLEKPNPKIDAAREKKVPTKNFAKAEAKRVGAEATGVHSQSSHQGDGDEPVRNRYVPNWGLRNDLRVCTFCACKELIPHLATLAEDKFLGALSNVEVVSRAYQTLGQSVVAQGELLKRHEQLNHDYVELWNRNDAHVLELDCLRSSVRRLEQDNEGLVNKLALHESAHSRCESREKELMDGLKDLERERDEWRTTVSNQVKHIRNMEKDLEPEEKIRVLEGEKLALSADLAQAEADRQRIVWEFIPVVVKWLHTSVEYRQSLAAPVSLCFTIGWLGGSA
ncbi:hypothetical protein Tco_1142863, partial [Tanacetum coccineum]